MKNNKLIAFVTTVTMIMSLFSAFVITAEAKTTTYTWDFTSSIFFTEPINKGSTIKSDQNETTAILKNPGVKLSLASNKVTGYQLVAKAEGMVTNALTITVPDGTSATISMQITAGSSSQQSILKDSKNVAVIDTTGYTKNQFGDAYTATLKCGETYSLDTTLGKPYIGKIVLTVESDGEDEPEPSTKPEESPSTKPEESPSTKPEESPSTKPEESPSTEPTELKAMDYKMSFDFSDCSEKYTSPALVKNGDGEYCMKIYATDKKYIECDANSKTIDGVSYSHRLRMRGEGSVSGGYRCLEMIPSREGSITVAFGHGSSSETAQRTLKLQQGESIKEAKVAMNSLTTAKFIVDAETPIYLYGDSAIEIRGVTYRPGDTKIDDGSDNVITDPKEACEADTEALKLNTLSQDVIYFDIDLPKTGANGSEITWESSNSKYIDIQMISSIKKNYTGVVTRPSENDGNIVDGGVPVTLTATVKNGTNTLTKTFDVSVRTCKNVVYHNDFQQDVGQPEEGTYKAISDNVTPATTLEYETQYIKGESWRSEPFRGIRIDTLKESRAFSQFNHNDKDTSAYIDKRVMSTKDTDFGNPKDSAADSENFVFYYSEFSPYGGSSTIPLWIELTDEASGKGPEGIVMMSMDMYVANGQNQFSLGLANASPSQMCRFMMGADHDKSLAVDGGNYKGAGYLRCYNNEASIDYLGGTGGYRVPEKKWFKVIMIANTDSHKWDLYFDGMQIATSLDFRNAEDCVSNIEFVLNRSYPRADKQTDPVAVYLMDNIYVENLTEDYTESYWDAVGIDSLDYNADTETYTAKADTPFLLQYQGTDGLSGNYFSWVSSDSSVLEIKTERIPVSELINYGYSEAQIALYNAAGIVDVSVVKAIPGKVSKDTEVTLRASVTVGEDEHEKEFKVIVKASSNETPAPSNNNTGGGSGGGGSYVSTKKKGVSGEILANAANAKPVTAAAPATKTAPSEVSYSDEIFTDLYETEWARDAILYLYSQDVVDGYGNGLYGVKDNVTREQFVKMLLTALDLPIYKDETLTFSDVVEGSWYEYYVETALELGIVSGISDTEFGVGEPISRQDMAVMAKRVLDYINKSDVTKPETEITDSPETEASTESEKAEDTETEDTDKATEENDTKEAEPKTEMIKLSFTDGDEVSEYAITAVSEMANKGIINGYEDSTFRPKNVLTRAETAVVIYKMMMEVFANE